MCAKYYELRLCFIKKNCTRQRLARLLNTASKFALFSVSGLKDEKLIKKSKPTRKLKHANSILEYFEYFFQISSKSIFIILSYSASKLARFFETHVYIVSSESLNCFKKNLELIRKNKERFMLYDLKRRTDPSLPREASSGD